MQTFAAPIKRLMTPALTAVAVCFAVAISAHAQYTFSTFSGSPGASGDTNGSLAAARYRNPTGAAADASGNIYIADTANQLIRKITPAGVVSTLAGSVGAVGTADGTGSAARFNYPWGLAVDAAGNVFVADSNNHTIRKITPGGVVSTFAGMPGVPGNTNGTGSAARFSNPSGLAIDSAGNLFVSDYTNTTIRKITPTGVVTTFAGSPAQYGFANGTGTAARFHYPDGIAIDEFDQLYVADSGNHTIRKITPDGVVTTLAGVAQQAGSRDSINGTPQFNTPVGVAIEPSGMLIVTDRNSNTVRRVTLAGYVSTIGGLADNPGSTNGAGVTARFKVPIGVLVADDEKLYVVDTSNQTIRRGWSVLSGSNYLNVPSTFNADIFRQRYPQLVTLFGDDDAAIWDYYVHRGVFEGMTDGEFSPAQYLSRNADLANLFGSDWSGAAVHWYNIGRREGRNIPSGFDAVGYLARNPDLEAQFLNDLYGAWLHYRDYGVFQGRSFDGFFNAEEYFQLNPDLRAPLNNNARSAILHWLENGQYEMRTAGVPAAFSAQLYVTLNPDLPASFATNRVAAWGHYWQYGIYEGRAYDHEFRAFDYLAINDDLRVAFGSDWKKGLMHWLRFGSTEGRLGRVPLMFDSEEYLNRYPEIEASWGNYATTVWQHYWLFGVYENRVFDNLFVPSEYLELNPDIAAVVGNDRRAGFMHWVRYGKTEGRQGRR
jgi:sugar lactone lactonase YvrE